VNIKILVCQIIGPAALGLQDLFLLPWLVMVNSMMLNNFALQAFVSRLAEVGDV